MSRQQPRLGLCCLFQDEPIRFRVTTARALRPFQRGEQLARISALCLHNAEALGQALRAVRRLGIGAFRIGSPLFPRFTHPEVGYALEQLPDEAAIRRALARVRRFRARHDIRLSFHPDQFVVLASPRPEVMAGASAELEYQGQLAQLVGADTINIHVGGAYGDKPAALARFARSFARLSSRVRRRLSLENDDTSYTVRDLLPLCDALSIPLVYDVHHHRCNPDDLTVSEATAASCQTWERVGREPYLHVSSPREGWGGKNPRPHAEYIDVADFPAPWRDLRATVDVEAKAKELAVLRLREDLSRRRLHRWAGGGLSPREIGPPVDRSRGAALRMRLLKGGAGHQQVPGRAARQPDRLLSRQPGGTRFYIDLPTREEEGDHT